LGFLTTAANDVAAPIHPKAMPVILTKPEEIEAWMGRSHCSAHEAQSRWQSLLQVAITSRILGNLAPDSVLF
jgi:putative SOS response-associated peptidase YedK